MNKTGLVARHTAGTSTEWGYYMYWIKPMRDSAPMSLVYIHKETWQCYSTSPFRYWLISAYSWWCNMMRLVRNIPTPSIKLAYCKQMWDTKYYDTGYDALKNTVCSHFFVFKNHTNCIQFNDYYRPPKKKVSRDGSTSSVNGSSVSFHKEYSF